MVGTVDPVASLPDRAPTWTELLLCVLLAVVYVPQALERTSVSAVAVIVGFVATLLAFGPGADSALGERVGRWVREIGVVGRAVTIAAYAIAVALLVRSGAIPTALFVDASYGVFLAVGCYVVALFVRTGTVSGW